MKTNGQLTSGTRGITAFAFLLLTVALWPYAEARAQWTTPDANNNIHNTNSGNVGVGTGTSAPEGTLHVQSSDTTTFKLVSTGSASTGRSIFQMYRGTASNANGWDFGYNADLSSENFILRELTSGAAATRLSIAKGTGRIGIGTTAPTEQLHVAGNLKVEGNIAARYQDVAEWVPSTQQLAAGTVVVLDAERSNHVLASAQAYDTRVAGVVSAQPGIVLGDGGAGKLIVATTGRVKVKVDATRAPVKVGDLLVTSEVEGVAMKSTPLDFGGTPIHRPGTIIGKALEPLEKGVGEILVLLSLQ